MTKHYCDRCVKEIKSLNDYILVKLGSEQYYYCVECVEKLKDFHNRVGEPTSIEDAMLGGEERI